VAATAAQDIRSRCADCSTLSDSGERFYVALVRSHLGDACRIARELPAARHHYERALAIFGGLGAREADGVRQKLAALGHELPASGAGPATEPIR
jgi:hypothetical protein